ncbi:MAG: OB-fold domain-containing protein [Chrysiogenetes bacterium]|nr:OB-fold domain-containing protein [Chrysiogenetes bacterium]
MSVGTSGTGTPFWDATREKRLVLQWCKACDRAIFYPRDFCPNCLGEELVWEDAKGTGVVYALSVMHKPGNPLMAQRVPYIVAIIELAEGVRMLSTVVGDGRITAKVGDKVRVSWEDLNDGRYLPVFELIARTS